MAPNGSPVRSASFRGSSFRPDFASSGASAGTCSGIHIPWPAKRPEAQIPERARARETGVLDFTFPPGGRGGPDERQRAILPGPSRTPTPGRNLSQSAPSLDPGGQNRMLTAAFKEILLSLLLLVPTATATTADDEDKVIVSIDDEDVDVHRHGPLIVRVGSRGFIGVTLVEITPELSAHYGAPREAGVVVSGVEADTPAGRAGVQVGDVITSVDGKRVRWTGDVSRAVRDKKGGETVEIEIVRDRAPRKVNVTVEERKARGRSIDLGDLKDDLRRRTWVMKDFDKSFPVIENLEDFRGMREKMENLEKRVRELEKRLSAR